MSNLRCVGSSLKALMLLSLLILIAGTTMVAQEYRATITGIVSDSSGAVIPGATVVARNLATNSQTRAGTDAAGVYVLPLLNIGNYQVTASATGFKSAVSRVTLDVSERHELDFKMEVGGVTENVTVVGEADLLNMANAGRGTTIGAQSVATLPLMAKNPYTYAYEAAGALHSNAQDSNTDDPYDNGGMDDIEINGAPAYTNEYLLDGAPNTNTERGRSGSLSFVPPADATEEVAIITNNYDAQYGRAGGGVISATLKSGTNKLHGAVYEYHRDADMIANTFQANMNNQGRGPFIWNQPGVTVDGPVYIPKVYDGRNKTFFMFSWEAIKKHTITNSPQTVPTPLERTGNFSDLHESNGTPITIYDPSTTGLGGGANLRLPFPQNTIPQSLFDPISSKLLTYIVLPNPQTGCTPNSSGFLNYCPQSDLVMAEHYNAYTYKIDRVISDRLRLSGDYVRNRRWRTDPTEGWAPATISFLDLQRFNQGANLSLTDTVSPTMVLTTRVGFTQHDFAYYPAPGQFNLTQVGFPQSLVSQEQAELFPLISMTNYAGIGTTNDSHDTSTNYYVTVSANKLVKTHALKFGGEFRVILDNTPAYSAMAFSFTPVFTQQNYVNASAASGNAFASFLMGQPSGGSAVINAMPAYGNHYYGVYLQDDWRVNHSLTLNLGVRWDYDSPITERYNRMTQGFDPTSPSNFVVPGLPLTGGLLFTSPQNRLANPRDLNNIQPRLGLAWHFLPKTVLRAGFGLSYLPLFVAGGNEGFTLTTPVIGSLNANATPYNQLSVNPFPSGILQTETGGLGTNVGQAITFVNQKRVIPYVYQYSFGFQHELPGQAVLDISYIGSQTRKQGVSKNIDVLTTAQLALGTAFLNTPVTPDPFAGLLPGLAMNTSVLERQMLLPYPQFTSVTQNQIPIGHSWYNSLQAIFTKRLSHGLHFLASFSYSEMMTASSFLNPQFTNDQLERVRVADDQPFRLTMNGGYEFPFFKGAKGFKHSLLGGWEFQAIALFMSGQPLGGVAAYPTGVDPFISNPGGPNQYYFNACSLTTAGVRQNCASATQAVAWIQQPSDTLRVTSSNWPQIRGKRPVTPASSLFKTFNPREGLQVQFRFEAFNTFNTPWFATANTTFGNSLFGMESPTQSNDPRMTQVALKILF